MSKVIPAARGALKKSDLRVANQRLLLNIIRENQGASRADIVRITGFSPSSVTFVVNRMLRDGLLVETPDGSHAQVGRRPFTLRIRPEAMIAVGAEISHLQSRVVTADLYGNLLKQREIKWQRDPRLMLARVGDAIRALAEGIPEERLLGAGISLPGTIDRATGRVIAAEHLDWFDFDAGAILSERSGVTCFFENDAKLGALAERWFCEPGARPLETFVFVVLGEGLGTGVMIEGRLLHGVSGEASEFGHTSIVHDGRRCPCGGIGCWEEYASQRAVERLYAGRINAKRRGRPVGVNEIVQLARQGDSTAIEALREVANYLGTGFANLNAAFNPEAIVVGDYLASAWDVMGDWVLTAMRSRGPQRFLSRLRVIPSRHGHDSTLKGAVALVLSRSLAGAGQFSGAPAPPLRAVKRA
ncbi:MAG: ROK family transcriptional regulator [Bryobacterales bacterium]|nr:ROK family transcriptional regulator [Bryobacterales bacterium]